MKRGTIQHPKVTELMKELQIPRYSAVGLLESLFHFTSTYAPVGDLGRWNDVAIADALDWPRKHAGALLNALCVSGWLDVHDDPGIRYVVHDWAEHCDDATKKRVGRSNRQFCQGTAQGRKVTGHVQSLRPDKTADIVRQNLPTADNGGLPVPLPLPLPLKKDREAKLPAVVAPSAISAREDGPIAAASQPVSKIEEPERQLPSGALHATGWKHWTIALNACRMSGLPEVDVRRVGAFALQKHPDPAEQWLINLVARGIDTLRKDGIDDRATYVFGWHLGGKAGKRPPSDEALKLATTRYRQAEDALRKNQSTPEDQERAKALLASLEIKQP